MKNKNVILISVAFVLLLVIVWFFFLRDGMNRGVTNPPTKEERERMEAIEDESSQIAPDAVPGIGVKPVGTLPDEPEPVPPVGTSTGTEEQL